MPKYSGIIGKTFISLKIFQETDVSIPLHICLCGGIASGKSTFLALLAHHAKKKGYNIGIYSEPVDQWEAFGPQETNMLQKMYEDPKNQAFAFQIMAAITKQQQIGNDQGIILVERSFLCQKLVFVPLLFDKGFLSIEEKYLLDMFIDQILQNPILQPDIYIYLQTRPETQLLRSKIRNRGAESGLTLEYLTEVDEKYEKWMLSEENSLVPTIILNTEKEGFLSEATALSVLDKCEKIYNENISLVEASKKAQKQMS